MIILYYSVFYSFDVFTYHFHLLLSTISLRLLPLVSRLNFLDLITRGLCSKGTGVRVACCYSRADPSFMQPPVSPTSVWEVYRRAPFVLGARRACPLMRKHAQPGRILRIPSRKLIDLITRGLCSKGTGGRVVLSSPTKHSLRCSCARTPALQEVYRPDQPPWLSGRMVVLLPPRAPAPIHTAPRV